MRGGEIARARLLALLVPALLLAGAYIGQYGFGLFPCEMCWWQRYPHFVALALALPAFLAPRPRFWVALAAIAILASGLIGGFHAGVEYGWWEGLTACSGVRDTGGDPLEAIMNAPLVSCNEVQWSLFGISLAGWNFAISTIAAIVIVRLLAKGRK